MIEFKVLIPLNSGLVFTENSSSQYRLGSLNPFEFRAGIYCKATAKAKFDAES